MYICLGKNTLLTKGKIKATLIDLENGMLYHLDTDVVHLLDEVLDREFVKDLFSQEEIDIIDYLLEHGLLVKAPKQHVQNSICLDSSNSKKSFAWIEVTDQCNLRCKHCYNESSCHKTNRMCIDTFRIVVDSLVECGITTVQLIGGEPLILGDELIEMMDYLKEKNLSIEVFTNGTLLSNELAGYFARNNIRVALSVYSYNPKEHDEVTTVVGSHKKTMEAISMLSQHHVKFRVANVLMAGISIGEKNTDLFDLKASKSIIRMSGRGNLSLLSKEMVRQQLITKETFSVPVSNNTIKRICNGHNCFSTKVYIGADTTVYPCVMERRFNYGVIKEQPLKDILAKHHYATKDHIDGCKDCEFRYCCFDCRPNSLSNDIYAKPWYCTYDPFSGTWKDTDCFIKEIEIRYSVSFQ